MNTALKSDLCITVAKKKEKDKGRERTENRIESRVELDIEAYSYVW